MKFELELVFISKCSTYDSMTVKQNLAFTLKRHATDLTRRNRREIEIVLESVGLAQAINTFRVIRRNAQKNCAGTLLYS
jgi:ABC-type transporter Mla maintaining outer membrane lipid asymmetry ATPase subunit MlaF